MTDTPPSTPPSTPRAVRLLDAYAATLAATGAVLVSLFVIPQTGAILAKASLSEYAYDPQGTVIRTGAFALMVVTYLTLFAVVIPPDPLLQPAGATPGLLGRIQLRALGATEGISDLILVGLGKLSDTGRRLVGVLLMVLGLLVARVLGPQEVPAAFQAPDLASSWPGIVITGLGAWLALLPTEYVRDPKQLTWGWRLPARVLTVVGVLAVVGQVLWAMPTWTAGAVSTQPYTTWGVGFLVFLAAVLGRLVDAAAVRTRWPARLLAALGAVALLGGDASDVLHSDGSRTVSTPEATAWYDAMLDRLAAMPGDGPAVVVAASGGGSRAALFAALTYQALEATPISAEPNAPSLGSHVLLVSSVSGGSLATAYYQREITARGALPTREAWRNHDAAAMGNAMRAESARLVGEARRRFGSDPGRKSLVASFEAVDSEMAQWPAAPLPDAPWLEKSGFVDDMGSDFMAAVLRAVIEPDLSRGEAITRLWVSRFGLGDLDNAAGSQMKGPLALFNSTEVDDGVRYVVGLPRLPSALFGGGVGAMDDANGERWVTAAQAARLSANFPWGFDVVHLPGLGDHPDVDLLDGGIVDNTGIDTLAQLFERLALAAGEGVQVPVGVTPAQTAKAEQLLAALRTRGVLLVEIDAGARPDEASGVSLFAGLTRPLRALSAAGSNNADAARDENVERIRSVVEVDGMPGNFLHLTWVCNRIDNVQTAWSLGTRDEAVTTLQFLAEQHRLAPVLGDLAGAFRPGVHDHALQERMDRETLSAREFQVATASAVDIPDGQRARQVEKVDQATTASAVRAITPRVSHTDGLGHPTPAPAPVILDPAAAAAAAALLPGLDPAAGLTPEQAQKLADDAEKAAAAAMKVAENAKAAAASAKALAGTAKQAAGTATAILNDPSKALADPSKTASQVTSTVKQATAQTKQAADSTKSAVDLVKKLVPTDDKDSKDDKDKKKK